MLGSEGGGLVSREDIMRRLELLRVEHRDDVALALLSVDHRHGGVLGESRTVGETLVCARRACEPRSRCCPTN